MHFGIWQLIDSGVGREELPLHYRDLSSGVPLWLYIYIYICIALNFLYAFKDAQLYAISLISQCRAISSAPLALRQPKK